MTKGYYIVGTVLLGVGAYLLYSKIKNGNVTFNFRNESVPEVSLGTHLNPPMEASESQTT